MERILLISEKPEKWEYFEKKLSGFYKFASANPRETIDFSAETIVATDEIENIKNILTKEKNGLLLYFSVIPEIWRLKSKPEN